MAVSVFIFLSMKSFLTGLGTQPGGFMFCENDKEKSNENWFLKIKLQSIK